MSKPTIGLEECQPPEAPMNLEDVTRWLEDHQLADSIGQELAIALGLKVDWTERNYETTRGRKTAAGLARLAWALIYEALPNR